MHLPIKRKHRVGIPGRHLGDARLQFVLGEGAVPYRVVRGEKDRILVLGSAYHDRNIVRHIRRRRIERVVRQIMAVNHRQIHSGRAVGSLPDPGSFAPARSPRSVLLAERKAAKGKAPVYMYSFNWQTPVLDGKLMAPHALDVPFVFDTLDAVGITGHSLAAQPIAAAKSATWAGFARTSIPDNKAIPHWPVYTAADRATMMIDTEWRVQNDPQREARLLWTKIAVA